MPRFEPYRVCFVCSGNICRSPTAEVVLRALVEEAGLADRIEVDSAGVGDWHVGDDADRRARAALRARGYTPPRHAAKQFTDVDFAERDVIIALDAGHERALRRLAPDPDEAAKVRLLLSFTPDAEDLDVPDPYYGGPDGFEHVLDLVEDACRGVLTDVRDELKTAR